MPTIAIFNGIIIQMFFGDHNPSYVHGLYGDTKALVRISDGVIIRGSLPRRQAHLVKSWAALRQTELMENWHNAQTGGRCFRIAGPDND
jgi:Domain of unknown function (DUF4160)